MLIFRVLIVVCVFLGLVVKLVFVWNIVDVFMGIMVLMNIIVIVIFFLKVVVIIRDYIK